MKFIYFICISKENHLNRIFFVPGLEKIRVFFFKPNPGGFYWAFLGFLNFDPYIDLKHHFTNEYILTTT